MDVREVFRLKKKLFKSKFETVYSRYLSIPNRDFSNVNAVKPKIAPHRKRISLISPGSSVRTKSTLPGDIFTLDYFCNAIFLLQEIVYFFAEVDRAPGLPTRVQTSWHLTSTTPHPLPLHVSCWLMFNPLMSHDRFPLSRPDSLQSISVQRIITPSLVRVKDGR